jgi:hypothetical protein
MAVTVPCTDGVKVSDTPRTDDLCGHFTMSRYVHSTNLYADKAHALEDHARQLERELAEAKQDAKSLQSFADLWYFAMDHAPGDFERIVTTCSPATWMHEIAKVRRGER